MRTQHANKGHALWPLAKIRANKTPVDWSTYQPLCRAALGRRVFKNFDLAELAGYIDAGARSSRTWDAGRPVPAILTDEVVGAKPRACLPTARPC